MNFGDLEKDFEKALMEFDRLKVEKIFDALETSENKVDFINNAVVGILKKIGEGWENGANSLSEIYMCGKICEELIKKLSMSGLIKRANAPKTAITTLEDHHQLGKRLVTSVLNSSGYDIIDYGHGTTVEEVAKRAMNEGIEVLMISVLMLPAALKIEKLAGIFKNAAAPIKVVTGGAPFNLDDKLWKKVGADYCGKNAFDAVKILDEISNGRPCR